MTARQALRRGFVPGFMRAGAAAGLIALSAPPASAHNFAFTDVTLSLRTDRFVADVGCDLDALALGVDSSADSAALFAEIAKLPVAERQALEARLAELLTRRLRVRFDGQAASFVVAFPEKGRPRPAGAPPSAFGLVARLEGPIPPGARTVSFFASRAFPPVRLTVVRADGGAAPPDLLAPGAESAPLPLGAAGPPPTAGQTLARFVALGFEHIIPAGLDHILFVLGLALFSPRLKPLLAQVTAFTLAHTVSLGCSVYGVMSLPSRVVEPLIALSIVYVAVENLLASRLRPARLLLVFGFGLLHGLGFAGALRELGWPEGRRLLALVSFNLGVEAGQLAVIGLALAILAVTAALGVDRRPLVRAGSILIAAVGVWWTVARLFAP
jgi:hypothetical protein